MARKIGYAAGSKTYREVRSSMSLRDRALGALGDFLDRYCRPADAPIFPGDAPLHQPNCGVVAMCMFTDRTYEEVAPILGAGRSKSWTGGTYCHQYQPTARTLGHETDAKGNGTLSITPRMTLAKLAESTKGKPGRIFATVKGHAVVVWDGLIFDQTFPAGALPSEHFSARQLVTFTMRRA